MRHIENGWLSVQAPSMPDIYCDCQHVTWADEVHIYAGRTFCSETCRDRFIVAKADLQDYTTFAIDEEYEALMLFLSENKEIITDLADCALPFCEIWQDICEQYAWQSEDFKWWFEQALEEREDCGERGE